MDKKLLDEYLVKLKKGDNDALDAIYHLTKRGVLCKIHTLKLKKKFCTTKMEQMDMLGF